ncbi:hypothetical protein SB6411_00217 [Klebsiella spallanzanii]|uniref:Phage tail protein n=1 Tax=Klebsiella spallanzanii TaxID=2587528 RepID=A0ABY6V728_9ENTR|nr:phage tail terminator protein [Klebsiella spallanzanii]VUS22723.1 hypothetical protein SB6411_00217 [Klebsiella spallanzanii]
MKNHIEIRKAALTAIKESLAESGTAGVVFFDGRPGFIDASDLPAVAVYISDAEVDGEGSTFCDDTWAATLHVEVFLKASSPDTDLDKWTEQLYRAVSESESLSELVMTFSPQGYDYQRDEEMMTWGSADLRIAITYSI